MGFNFFKTQHLVLNRGGDWRIYHKGTNFLYLVLEGPEETTKLADEIFETLAAGRKIVKHKTKWEVQ